MKKAIEKAGQWTGEKLGKFDVTKPDEQFLDLEKKTDETDLLVKKLIARTEEYLQPNPASRAKLRVLHMSGKGETKYAQPEGELAEVMLHAGGSLGDTQLAHALRALGEAENQVAETRHTLDGRVVEVLLKPLDEFHSREVKEVMKLRQKMDSRRLQYDLKKRAKEKKPHDAKTEDEFQDAERRFEDIKEAVHNTMCTLLESQGEQVGQLLAFAEAQKEYHQNATTIMEAAVLQLRHVASEAPSTHVERYKRHTTAGVTGTATGQSYASPPVSPKAGYVVALYDFTAASENELSFRQGERIQVLRQVDGEWTEGTLGVRKGIFPTSYVESQ